MKRQDEELNVRERAMVALLREMVENMNPPRIEHANTSESARAAVMHEQLKHYRRRALHIMRGPSPRRAYKIPVKR